MSLRPRAAPASLPPVERYHWARAYRQGRLVAGRVELRFRLQPPQQRYVELREIGFGLRELERSP
jgi:hypothetical protein